MKRLFGWQAMPPGGLRDALRALELRRGAPTEADAPRPKPLPSPKVKPLPGQLTLDEYEHKHEQEPGGR
jgi:hypothetical protein